MDLVIIGVSVKIVCSIVSILFVIGLLSKSNLKIIVFIRDSTWFVLRFLFVS